MMLEYNIKYDKMKSELYINFKQTGQQKCLSEKARPEL